jgi:hypothetical protein
MGIKVLLKYQRGRFVINRLTAMLRQYRGSVTLIDQHGIDAESAVKLVGKAPASHAQVMFGAIRMQRQTHDHALRLPLCEQLRYGIELAVIGCGFDDLQRVRPPYQGIAYRDANTLQAKVERQYRHHAQAVAQTKAPEDPQKAAIKPRRARRASCMPGFPGQSVWINAQQIHRGDEA